MEISKSRRHLISIEDLQMEDLNNIIARGLMYADRKVAIEKTLNDLIIGIYFRKTSTRTRVSFSSASLSLGAHIISIGPNDLQENTGESIEDSTKVLSGMLDAFVARTAGSMDEMRKFSAQNTMSVINAMSAEEHPTQAITDLITMKQRFGEIAGLRILYIGEGNNTAAALALSLSRFPGTSTYFVTPPGYGLSSSILDKAKRIANQCGSLIEESCEVKDLPSEIDVIYTTRWRTTGSEKKDPNWKTIFAPYSVGEKLVSNYKNAIFMHDLPAHVGDEIDEGVLNSAASVVFVQAQNKLHSARSILEWCLNK